MNIDGSQAMLDVAESISRQLLIWRRDQNPIDRIMKANSDELLAAVISAAYFAAKLRGEEAADDDGQAEVERLVAFLGLSELAKAYLDKRHQPAHEETGRDDSQ